MISTPKHILLVNKPVGMTSFDVIRELRKRTGIRKYGHAGTLDPLASGLMILGVEQGTKLLNDFIKLDKEYIAEIRIGESRTTDDLEGEIIDEREVADLHVDLVKEKLKELIGVVRLPISAYSAIKKDGKPLYKKARAAAEKGEVFTDVPLRDMEVFKAELIEGKAVVIDGKKRFVATVRFHVASGTYIRSLGKELGRLLGYPATLQALCRTKVGQYTLSEAQQLEDFK